MSVNSIEFAREVLECQERGEASVPLRAAVDEERTSEVPVERVVVPALQSGWARLPNPKAPVDRQRIVQVLFTSGTTGAAKAIALSAENVLGTSERLNRVMGLSSEIREYIGVPVHYSFGLGRVRAVTQAGGEFFVPENGFDPSELAELLKRGAVNAVSAVPTLIRVLLQNSDLFEAHRARMRWIEIGSQHMAREEKLRIRELFPNATIVQHYGLTEASRTTFLKIHEASVEELDSVGAAESPVAVRLDAEQRIQIRGPHVARFAIRRGELIQLTDSEGWLQTNDLGEIHAGALRFRGRADDVVNCGGIKLFPEAIEHELSARLPQGAALAVARVDDGLRGDGILVAYTNGLGLSDAAVRQAAVAAVAQLGVQAAGAIVVRQVAEIPRTANGKVRRRALASQPAVTQLASAAPEAGSAALSVEPLEERLLRIWKEVLRAPNLTVNDSFYDVGGDSLTAIAVALRMEKAGLEKKVTRGIFLGKTIAQIVGETTSAPTETAPPAPGVALAATSSGAAETAPLATVSAPGPLPSAEFQALELRLLKLWSEVLGGVTLGPNDSFFDVGGDSLTAVNVALKMERSGLDKKLARGVFQGKTIAQLVAEAAAASRLTQAPSATASAPPRAVGAPAPPRPSPPDAAPVALIAAAPIEAGASERAPRLTGVKLAELTDATNLVRGIVILCIISSHWLPIFFQPSLTLRRYGFLLHPMFNLGSPTLAVVFGLSVSLFYARQAERSWESFLRNVRTGTWMTLGGAALYACVEIMSRAARGLPFDAGEIPVMFCTALLYYGLATASLPLWIRAVKNEPRRIWALLFASLCLYTLYLALQRLDQRWFPSGPANRSQEALTLLLLGKWGLPQMASLSLFGAALGLIFERRLRGRGELSQFLAPGLLMVLAGGMLSLASGKPGLWFSFPRNSDLWSIISYSGIIVTLVGCRGRYWNQWLAHAPLRHLIHWVSTFGVGLFPLFVVQSLVYHSSIVVMTLTGWSHPWALLPCVLAFFAISAFPLSRIHALYYAEK